jgi:phage tail-like protein
MPAPQFTVNTKRYDPYKNFKFRVYWVGKTDPVAGISKVGTLKRTTEVVTHREGNDPSTPRHSPGQTKFDPIMLERGVTHDKEFEQWANIVWKFRAGLGSEVKLNDYEFRKDITIEMMNEAGQPVLRYIVFRCWVSEFQALPELDANANAVAIEHIQLQNEGWQRDTSLAEPTGATIDGEYIPL